MERAERVPGGQEEADRERPSAADERQIAGRLGDERRSHGGDQNRGKNQETGVDVEQGSDEATTRL